MSYRCQLNSDAGVMEELVVMCHTGAVNQIKEHLKGDRIYGVIFKVLVQ